MIEEIGRLLINTDSQLSQKIEDDDYEEEIEENINEDKFDKPQFENLLHKCTTQIIGIEEKIKKSKQKNQKLINDIISDMNNMKDKMNKILKNSEGAYGNCDDVRFSVYSLKEFIEGIKNRL